MPLHPVAIELLRAPARWGSAAPTSPASPRRRLRRGREQLGDAVSVYLDGGPRRPVPSTIVDVTGDRMPRSLRLGAVSLEELREVVPDLDGDYGDQS